MEVEVFVIVTKLLDNKVNGKTSNQYFYIFFHILYLIHPRYSIERRKYVNAGLSKNTCIQPRTVPKTNSKSDNSETP